MTLRQYLALMIAATAAAWGAVALVITKVDPDVAHASVFVVFGIALFLAITGTFSLLGFAVRVAVFKKTVVVSREVAASFRQAVLLALLFVILLMTNAKGVLTWWLALLLGCLVVIGEFLSISMRIRRKK